MLTFFDDDWIAKFEEKVHTLIEKKVVDWAAGQVEKAPKTGRLHLQCYFAFSKKIRYSQVKKLVGDQSVHIEPRRGTHQEALEYVTKEETRAGGQFVLGNDGTVKKASGDKYKAMFEDVRSGSDDLRLAEDHGGLWLRYYKALQYYRTLTVPARDFKTEVRVYYGKSGVGKSRRATYEAGANAYRKPRGEWWDGYDGSSNVIIDDFYGWLAFDELLRCLDRYSHRVPIKGGFVNFAPKLVIITSNVEPREWYSSEKISDMRFEALLRRLEVILRMEEEWLPPTILNEETGTLEPTNG